jgi:hypothetical protein
MQLILGAAKFEKQWNDVVVNGRQPYRRTRLRRRTIRPKKTIE